jgi:hypothetical protein
LSKTITTLLADSSYLALYAILFPYVACTRNLYCLQILVVPKSAVMQSLYSFVSLNARNINAAITLNIMMYLVAVNFNFCPFSLAYYDGRSPYFKS